MYAWRNSPLPGQTHVINGETLISGGVDTWIFDRVSRAPRGVYPGRVRVFQYCPSAVGTRDGGRTCVHSTHQHGLIMRVVAPSVFGLYLAGENGLKA